MSLFILVRLPQTCRVLMAHEMHSYPGSLFIHERCHVFFDIVVTLFLAIYLMNEYIPCRQQVRCKPWQSVLFFRIFGFARNALVSYPCKLPDARVCPQLPSSRNGSVVAGFSLFHDERCSRNDKRYEGFACSRRRRQPGGDSRGAFFLTPPAPVGANPTYVLSALQGCEGLWSYGYGSA